MKRVFTLLMMCWIGPVTGGAQEGPLTVKNDTVIEEQLKFAPQREEVDLSTNGQVYKLKPAVDIPIVAVGAAWSLYAFTKIYNKDEIDHNIVANLSADDVNSFDRGAAGNTDQTLSDNSDFLFYGSMPLPAFLFIDKKIRKDAAKIGFLYLESFAINGLLYTGSVYFVDRYRPETYNTSIPVSDRANGNNKNSFFAGHVSVVANATFFMAKVYNDYHPESSWKWVFWGGAAAATGSMIYMRHAAGKHFPSDLIVGTVVGTLSGILVPHFHKNKNVQDQAWRLSPYMNPNGDGMGLSFTYKIK